MQLIRMVSPRWCVLCSIPMLLFVFIHFYGSHSTSDGLNPHLEFTDHLSMALIQAGMQILRDDHNVEPEDDVVDSEVRKAISNSMVLIIVISTAHVSPVLLFHELVVLMLLVVLPTLLFVFMHCFYCSNKPSSAAASTHTVVDESKGYQFGAFLGFRDLKRHLGFTHHLAKALVQERVRIFRDDRNVEPGDHVESEVRKAISNSSVYVPVISSDHVSPFFLDELVLMVKQRKEESDHLVLPVFYHVHPSVVVDFRTGPFCGAFADLSQKLEDARNQRNGAIIQAGNPMPLLPFRPTQDALAKAQRSLHQKALCLKKEMEDISQRLLKWKEALGDIAGLKPVHVDVDSHESEAVKLIVARVVKHVTTKQSLLRIG